MTTPRVPIAKRLEAVRFYRDNKVSLKMSLKEVAKRFGVSKRSLIRWLHEYDPKIRFVSFLPIKIEPPDDLHDTIPAIPSPVIPVAVTIGNGSTLHFHLRSIDEISALVLSLEKRC